MNSIELRKAFLDFFKNKNHTIVHSAPMVVKNDPSLMFTNAGMNQFKDVFLGNEPAKSKRIADTQKCLRVSGKHNDLEEVGHDTYHHTMFEMLGNWSFGDYFKKEAIHWAWEFLTETINLDKNRLYATIFEGDKADKIERDNEAFNYWNEFLPAERILNGNKKDNFWEMGDTGPCGPCSEIHIDLRDETEREAINGALLVNKDHPLVIEIWNLVFIQYNRKANGSLELLPAKHVDTGMGFERLCMAVQGKKSNYDTDVFQPIIQQIAKNSGSVYGEDKDKDIAMRVIADHLRAISFSIADGQLPSNNKAGYVIRRILRRAVRYAYTFLDQKEAFIYKLVPVLVKNMGNAFPELNAQEELIAKVIKEEENAFLRTLETGIKILDQLMEECKATNKPLVSGKNAFELYDTYGFPLDLTELILKENGLKADQAEFASEMNKQKERSRAAAVVETDDWVSIRTEEKTLFVGYDELESDIQLIKYRKVSAKNKTLFHLVFNKSPFYAESGGQVGDSGYIEADGEKTSIENTIKENNLIIHIAKKLPTKPNATFHAVVNKNNRINIENNHSATHLLHFALRKVLGTHVEQKGSLVHPDYLRFDFSHFQKMSKEELVQVEEMVNAEIKKNLLLKEKRAVPLTEAKNTGAMMLFGEKYDDEVRVIQFGDSIELCGGTHVNATSQIGFFKILSESSISAGIRRIEAISGDKAEQYIKNAFSTLEEIEEVLGHPKDLKKSIENLLTEQKTLQKKIEHFVKEQTKAIKAELKSQIQCINGLNVIAAEIKNIESANEIKDLAFQLRSEIKNLILIVGAEINEKPSLTLMISDHLVKEKGMHAGNLVRESAKIFQGGGGGQAFFATAGGKDVHKLSEALNHLKKNVETIIE